MSAWVRSARAEFPLGERPPFPRLTLSQPTARMRRTCGLIAARRRESGLKGLQLRTSGCLGLFTLGRPLSENCNAVGTQVSMQQAAWGRGRGRPGAGGTWDGYRGLFPPRTLASGMHS